MINEIEDLIYSDHNITGSATLILIINQLQKDILYKEQGQPGAGIRFRLSKNTPDPKPT